MSPVNQAANMFGLLSEQEQLIIIALMQRLLPDDIATQDDIIASMKAEEEYLAGETTDLESINWD